MKRLAYYFAFLIVVWSFFRYFTRLPEVIDELWFKPVIWLVPLFWWNLSLNKKLKMFAGSGLKAIMPGVILGVVYFLILDRFRFSQIEITLNTLGVIVATAITEELTFSGFVAGYLHRVRGDRWTNLVFVGIMVGLLRLPLLVFVYKLGAGEISGVVGVAAAMGAINAWLRLRTDSVISPIVARIGANLAVLG